MASAILWASSVRSPAYRTYHPDNARKIVALTLFIKAIFLYPEAAAAASKCRLTVRQADWLAREARVKDLVPIHFSPRYADREQALGEDARATFLGVCRT